MDANKMRSRESIAVLYRSRIGESTGRVKRSRRKSKYWSSKEERRDQQTGRRETCNDRRTRQLGMEKGEQREERDGISCYLMNGLMCLILRRIFHLNKASESSS